MRRNAVATERGNNKPRRKNAGKKSININLLISTNTEQETEIVPYQVQSPSWG